MEFKDELKDVLLAMNLENVDADNMSHTQLGNVKEAVEDFIVIKSGNLPHEEVHWVLSDGLPELVVFFKALRCLELMMNPPEGEIISVDVLLRDYGLWAGHHVVGDSRYTSPRDYVVEYEDLSMGSAQDFLRQFYTEETTHDILVELYGASEVTVVKDVDLPF